MKKLIVILFISFLSLSLTVNKGCIDTVSKQQYTEYSDSIATYRNGVRNGFYVIDKELTPKGFDGKDSLDWRNIEIL